ncbi:MAG TPA: hypothetical protein VFL49_04635, partial [Pseudolabrys sp.]|nr:hypothetical protein [Pseudolabrys sp.]
NKEIASAFTDKPAEPAAQDSAPSAETPLPEISVPLPEPLPPVTNADFAVPPEPLKEDARDLLPPSPKVEGAA